MNKYQVFSPRLLVFSGHVPYRREVELQLQRMQTTAAGRNVLKFIGAGRKDVRILPFRPTNKEPVNAYARPDLSENYSNAYAKGAPLMMPLKIGNYDIMLPTAADYGTGRGISTVVEYSPATWLEVNRRAKVVRPGEGPAEVLIHELTHAMRMGHGIYYDFSVWNNMRMDNYEEFCSILVANVYRSERGFTHMRLNHWGSDAMRLGATGATYYAKYSDLIDRWFSAQKDFCLAMASVNAKFNPFQAAAETLGLIAKAPGRTP